MTVLERKTFLKQKIDNLTDESILDELGHLFDDQSVYKFTPEQLVKVEEALAQYERGEFYTQEEMDKEMDEWFREQEK